MGLGVCIIGNNTLKESELKSLFNIEKDLEVHSGKNIDIFEKERTKDKRTTEEECEKGVLRYSRLSDFSSG